MRKIRLSEIAHGRSGDKGDSSDIGLFAFDAHGYEILKKYVTAERVMAHFAPIATGPVERYEVPNLEALKFVVHGALGGGAARSLRSDNLGKSMANALLWMEIEVEE